LSVRKYCQLFTHESNTFLLNNAPFKLMEAKTPRNPQTSVFPLHYVDPHLIHQCLGRRHSPVTTQTTARWFHAFPHNYATKSPLVTMGRPKFTPKTARSPSTITTSI